MREIKKTKEFIIYKIQGAYKRSIIGEKLMSEGFKFITDNYGSRISDNENEEQGYYIHCTKKFTEDLRDVLLVRKNSKLEKLAEEIVEKIN